MASDDRSIRLSPDSTPVPEPLLLAHARGETLLLCGAGISVPSGLPTFAQLVLDVYERLDPAVHQVLVEFDEARRGAWKIAGGDASHYEGSENTRSVAPTVDTSSLRDDQAAEARKFQSGELDMVLGMLERRLDGSRRRDSAVRVEVDRRLRRDLSGHVPKPNSLHRAVRRIADRSIAVTVATTNFDRLLEKTRPSRTRTPPVHALPTIPRPDRTDAFAGIFHIHGVLDRAVGKIDGLVLTDEDFAEVYSNRTVVRDLVYDTARLYDLVLVGYSANDPPMRYLLSAIAADRVRFPELRRCYAFVPAEGVPDGAELATWRARGIEPIPYDAAGGHRALRITLERWAALSPHVDSGSALDATIKKIVKRAPADTAEDDRVLFDHLVRRGNADERLRIVRFASTVGANIAWLEASLAVLKEPRRSPGSPHVPGTAIDVLDLGRQIERTVGVFVRQRLDERGVLEWAVGLPPNRRAERVAVLDAVHFDMEGTVREPWTGAWALIEESWAGDANDDSRWATVHEVERRLKAGERSAVLARGIADHVTPRLRVRRRENPTGIAVVQMHKILHRPTLGTLLHATIVSDGLVDPFALGLDHVSESVFLRMLADELDAALVRGMDVARRLGLNKRIPFGNPRRVYYGRSLEGGDDRGDRDAGTGGELTAVVKLLHEVVRRLSALDRSAARAIMRRWQPCRTPLHTRLWAAFASDRELCSNEGVREGLLAIGHREFWNVGLYPEVAELRAARMGQLSPEASAPLFARLRRGVPREAVDPSATGDELKRWKRRSAVQELERVRLASREGVLPPPYQTWLDKHFVEFPELVGMSGSEGLDVDFVDWVPDYRPDERLDTLEGVERLDTIERALISRSASWNDDSRRRVLAWVRVPPNASKLLHDLAETGERADAYPTILDWLHQMHPSNGLGATLQESDARRLDVRNALSTLNVLPETAISHSMEGVSAWLFNWRNEVGTVEELLPIWRKV